LEQINPAEQKLRLKEKLNVLNLKRLKDFFSKQEEFA